jgi:hypothetical protein
MAGTINPKLINEFESHIKDVFANYTKRDKTLGIPSNIHNIAVTEFRSNIEDVKKTYMNKVIQKNPEVEIKKTWKQNKQLSNIFRRSHNAVNGKTIPINIKFIVPIFSHVGGRWHKTGELILMDRPHDQNAPLNQIIGCNCELIYSARRKT